MSETHDDHTADYLRETVVGLNILKKLARDDESGLTGEDHHTLVCAEELVRDEIQAIEEDSDDE